MLIPPGTPPSTARNLLFSVPSDESCGCSETAKQAVMQGNRKKVFSIPALTIPIFLVATIARRISAFAPTS